MTSKRGGAVTALVRAEHGAGPIRISPSERKVLDEALRRGEDLREELETKTLEYGRWLLEAIFANDTTSALDDKAQNAVWLELVRRAGEPTLGLTRHLLYVALRIAAHDRRITANAWRGLDAGRKELLLPCATTAPCSPLRAMSPTSICRNPRRMSTSPVCSPRAARGGTSLRVMSSMFRRQA